MPDPGHEYRRRAAARHETFLAREQEQLRLSALRLGTFGAGVAVAALAWWNLVSPLWLVIPAAVFLVLVRRHDRAIRARDDAARAEAFYERGIARIEDRWIGLGEPGDRFADDTHLYANDLDLFGRGSVFELLSIARTQAGEETLASWLKQPAPAPVIAARQTAVVELTPALDLREALALAGTEVRAGVHSAELIAWAQGPPQLGPRWRRNAAIGLTAAAVATAIWWAVSGAFLPFVLTLVVRGAVLRGHRARVDAVLHAADAPARELAVLRQLLLRIERETFESPMLKALHDRIARPVTREGSAPMRASSVVARLERLLEAHDWEHNLIFTPIALLLMWGTHLAWAVEAWRARHGGEIAAWLSAVGELEALSSLAAYRYEHPDDPFPEIAAPARDGSGRTAVFEGEQLGHPLIPRARMVPNDVRLGPDRALLVVSGSNMSGKSTLLRTVGVNAVLAFAGAPVRAQRLRLTPLAIGATLRIQDSLQEGRSRFYAEITRIRAIVDRAEGERPLLFLLDELFHGTNSHDRLVGASGVLRGLLERGAIGLITTHDLALTAIASAVGGRAANVHFEDRFEGGEMRFDYRIKDGPVTRSNALALMRAVGLQVDAESGRAPDG